MFNATNTPRILKNATFSARIRERCEIQILFLVGGSRAQKYKHSSEIHLGTIGSHELAYVISFEDESSWTTRPRKPIAEFLCQLGCSA